MVGPALGGLLVATVGVDVAFVVDAATYLVSAVLLSLPPCHGRRGRKRKPVRRGPAGPGSATSSAARIPLAIVVGAFLTILTINMTVPAEVFLAKETFDAGDAGYGLLVSLYGGGMVLGSAMMVVLGDRVRLVLMYFLSIFAGPGAGRNGPVTRLRPRARCADGRGCRHRHRERRDRYNPTKAGARSLPGTCILHEVPGYSVGEAFAYGVGGAIVDASGARFTYILAGVATAAAGLIILVFLAIASDSQ